MADTFLPFRFMGLLESVSHSAVCELKVKNCFVGFPNHPSLLALSSCCLNRSFIGVNWWVHCVENENRYEHGLGNI